jgi:hypothetical protein
MAITLVGKNDSVTNDIYLLAADVHFLKDGMASVETINRTDARNDVKTSWYPGKDA